jgi:hypothetical protein
MVLANVRERALKRDPRLAYFEWAAAQSLESLDPDDRDGWARANPALGVRITTEFVESEQRAMQPKTFAVERLGVGDWPDSLGEDADRISGEQWGACLDPDSQPSRLECVAFDVRPDRSGATIAAAGTLEDGRRFVRVLAHGAGTGWVSSRLEAIVERHEPAAILVDERSPAAALIAKLENAGIDLTAVNGSEYAAACGSFYDSVMQRTVLHAGEPELTAAVRGAARRPLGMRGRGRVSLRSWISVRSWRPRWRCVAWIVSSTACTRTGASWFSVSTTNAGDQWLSGTACSGGRLQLRRWTTRPGGC